MAPSRLHTAVSLGSSSASGAWRREPDAPLRMLLLADLGGSARLSLAQRQPLAVDIDSFDALFGRVQPGLLLDLEGQSLRCAFESLDDFHPDALLARLPVFEALRRLREELKDPAQFRRVAAALGVPDPSPAAATVPATSADAGADVQRLLGRPLSEPQPTAPNVADALQAWLRQTMAPHLQPNVSHEQGALRAAADAALGTLMRRVLHHPRLQALEAAWLGIDRLVRELELGETMQLWVLDISREEIEAEIAAHHADLSGSYLHRWLCGREAADSPRWGLWVVDQAFGPGAGDVQMLAALGALAARASAPLLAAALPQAAGAANWAQLREPGTWLAEDNPALVHWSALRSSPMANWIGLALPRVLMRLPYGQTTDPITSFSFEEMSTPREHEAYLWGHAGAALALLAGRAFAQDGWNLSLDSQLMLDDLPSCVVEEDGTKHQQPGAELLLSEQSAAALAERGLMPLMSWKDRPAASLLRWQSVAQPLAPLSGLGA